MNSFKVPVMLSNHHVHLLAEDVETLFGPGYVATKNDPNDPRVKEYLAAERVDLIGPSGSIKGVRFFGGPGARYTQAELLSSDLFKLGVSAPIAMSGDHSNAAEITIAGPSGQITKKCAIVAARHVHLNPDIAEKLGVKNGEKFSLKTSGTRSLTLHNVEARVMQISRDMVHIDFDEGNAAGLKNNDIVEIFK